MPSKSKKQASLMRAVAHNPKFAKKVGIPQSVGEDFVAADKRTGRYARGGSVLKALSEPRMPPVKPARMPELRAADRTIANARERLHRLRKAKGGKVKSIKSAVGRLFNVGSILRDADVAGYDSSDVGRLERQHIVHASDKSHAKEIVHKNNPGFKVFAVGTLNEHGLEDEAPDYVHLRLGDSELRDEGT